MTSFQHLDPASPVTVSPGTTLFQDTNYAVPYVQAVNSVNNTNATNTPAGGRYWLSVPRRVDDPTWDVIIINFRDAVSISQISFDLFQFAQNWELWYYEDSTPKPSTDGNAYIDPTTRIPVLDRSLRPLTGRIVTGNINQWYGYRYQIRPLVARSLELRIQRTNDGNLNPSSMYSVGVRNLLCKREIYSEQDAMLPLENGVDPMGNLVESYIKKWEPELAIDGATYSFWKSAPQPSHDAVACFYIDCRDVRGNAQRIDQMYLDPTHTGSALNLYYSSDDTVGPRMLNLSRVAPQNEYNVNWIKSVGLDMSISTANYSISLDQLNLDSTGSLWIAGTWIPGFNASGPPGVNLTLVSNTKNNIQITYLSQLHSFQVVWGSFTGTFPCLAFFQDRELYFSLRIVQDSSSDLSHAQLTTSNLLYPDTDLYPDPQIFPVAAQQYVGGVPPGIYFLALDALGYTLSSGTLFMNPDEVDLSGTISLNYCQGYIKHLFIKQDVVQSTEVLAALSDMSTYLFPLDPISSSQMEFQHSPLINMIYAADFSKNELGFGGVDPLYFAEKEWTPVWMDWVTFKGMYYFPDVVYAKYLKFEFSQLTQEPYTIYDSGITVEYQTFPVSVTAISKTTTTDVSTFIATHTTQSSATRGILYDNYYTINSSQQSQSTAAPVYFVNLGTDTINTVPLLYDQPVRNTLTSETYTTSTEAIYASTNTQVMAADAYYTVVSGDWLIKLGKTYSIPWQEIYSANRTLIDQDPRVKLLPQRSPGWWIFPGQQLRIPNSIMDQITNTSTTTEKVVSTSTITTARCRFVKTQVHRYDYQTVQRDAAIAYFAGIREVKIYRLDYTVAVDTEVYDFPLYDTVSFHMTNMIQYAYSGGWESTSTILLPSDLLYPQLNLYPSTQLFPAGSGSYIPSTAGWQDTHHTWADPGSNWGYVPNPPQGSVESAIWNSLSLVNAIEIMVYDRGLHQPITGRELAPVSLADSPVGYWTSLSEDWSDVQTVWGTRSALVAEEFHSKIQYGGQSAFSVYRPGGVGVAGITSTDFSVPGHARIRVSVDYYRPVDTANDLIVQLVDVGDPLNEYVVFQQKITEYYVGKWAVYHSRFFPLGDYPIANAEVRLIISGTHEEQIYIGTLYPQMTTILYEYSNDGGVHYYEASDIVYSESTIKGLVFPSPNNQLRARVTMFDVENDFVFGQTITPDYI